MKTKNPKLYRELSEPFASFDVLNAAISAFVDEVYELRVKHKLPDVTLVISGNVALDADDETSTATYAHFGNPDRAVQMLAYALGREEEQQLALLRDIRSRARKASEPKP